MAYIGRSVDVGMFEKQVITADSSTTTFTLTFAVGSANSLLVVYGGVVQEPAVAYSVSGGGQQIVFSEAPVTGTTTYIIYLGKQLTTPRAAGQETTKQTFAGDGSTVTFTLTDPPVVPAGIMVFVDGILQREGSGNNYVSSGSTITFTSAPDSSAEIDVYTLVKEKVSIDTVADGSITVTKLAAGHPTWNGAGETVIATASTGNSLRITNTGSGNSLLVEDSASTDSTPFVITAGGDVGIGTSSPTSLLSVGTLGTTAAPVIQIGSSTTGTGSVYFGDGSAGTDSYRGYIEYNHASDAMVLATSTAERLRITSAGNVGIGTSSPARKLNVAVAHSSGTIVPAIKIATSGGYDSNAGTAIDFGLDQGDYPTWVTGRIASPRTGNNWGGSLTFSTNDNNSATDLVERMRISSAGDVGISAGTLFVNRASGLTQLRTGVNTDASLATGEGIEFSTTSSTGTRVLSFDRAAGAFRRLDLAGNAIHMSPNNSTSVIVNGFGLGLGASTPASGTGITFPATQSASSDANTLDDYEEGTYNVTMTPSTSGSITLQTGFTSMSYTKVGRVVTIVGNPRILSVSSPTGGIYLTLPFPVRNGTSTTSRAGSSITYYNNSSSPLYFTSMPCAAGEGSTSLTIYVNAANPAAIVPDANDELYVSYTYFTD